MSTHTLTTLIAWVVFLTLPSRLCAYPFTTKKKKKEIRNNLNAVHGGSLEKPKLNMRGIQAAVTQFGQIELLMLFMTYRNGSFVRFEL